MCCIAIIVQGVPSYLLKSVHVESFRDHFDLDGIPITTKITRRSGTKIQYYLDRSAS